MLINAGEPHATEGEVMKKVLNETTERIIEKIDNKTVTVEPIVNLAPVLKASMLDTLTEALGKHGINIKHIAELALYMNGTSLINLIEQSSFEELNEEMLARFIPFLEESLEIIFLKVLNKELSTSFIPVLVPYVSSSLVEAAVIDGQLDYEVLQLLKS